MVDLGLLRHLYGNAYIIALPDGRNVPWKPLSLKEFIEIDSIRQAGVYSNGQIEDEIFKKCVLDCVLVDNLDKLKAGTVSTVAGVILSYSSPQTIDELNNFLNIKRAQISENVFHQMVITICQAFPAYTPDDIYAMDYETVMQRVALAEQKLASVGILAEPIHFGTQDEQSQERKPSDRKINKRLHEIHQQQQTKRAPPPSPPPAAERTVITTKDMAEAQAAYTGMERSDRISRETKMVKETTDVYDRYLEQMRKGEKVVVPSHEERMQAARERAAENEKKFNKHMHVKAKSDAREMAELLEIRERARDKKARRAKKRGR